MRVYYATILVVVILALAAQRKRSLAFAGFTEDGKSSWRYNVVYVALAAILLILVAGLRWKVGTDYGGYIKGYTTRVNTPWSDITYFDEPGLYVIAKLASVIYDDYATMFLLASLLTVGLQVRTISKYSDMLAFSLLLYLFMGCWHTSFNAVRQCLAGAVLFAGHRYIYDRKFIKYLLCVFLASTFHVTAIIMLPVYFLATRKIDLKQILILGLGAMLLSYSYDFIFDLIGLYKGHELEISSYMTNSVNIYRILVSFAPVLLSVILMSRITLDREETFYINLLIVNAIMMFATANSTYLARVGIYTDIYAAIALPKLIRSVKRSQQAAFMIFVVALYAVFWYWEVSSRATLNGFQWIFGRPGK